MERGFVKMKNEVRPNGVKRRSHTHTSDEAINPMVKRQAHELGQVGRIRVTFV